MKSQNYFFNPFARLLLFFNHLTERQPVPHSKIAKAAIAAFAVRDPLLENRELTIEILMRPF